MSCGESKSCCKFQVIECQWYFKMSAPSATWYENTRLWFLLVKKPQVLLIILLLVTYILIKGNAKILLEFIENKDIISFKFTKILNLSIDSLEVHKAQVLKKKLSEWLSGEVRPPPTMRGSGYWKTGYIHRGVGQGRHSPWCHSPARGDK